MSLYGFLPKSNNSYSSLFFKQSKRRLVTSVSKRDSSYYTDKDKVVSITYEEIGLFPRSFSRVLDRFLKQLFSDVDNLVIQEYRFYRYLFLTTIKTIFILFFVPFLINFAAKNYVVKPITEYFWNKSHPEIFLNSYEQKRAFTELEKFEEKIYFETLVESYSQYSYSFKAKEKVGRAENFAPFKNLNGRQDVLAVSKNAFELEVQSKCSDNFGKNVTLCNIEPIQGFPTVTASHKPNRFVSLWRDACPSSEANLINHAGEQSDFFSLSFSPLQKQKADKQISVEGKGEIKYLPTKNAQPNSASSVSNSSLTLEQEHVTTNFVPCDVFPSQQGAHVRKNKDISKLYQEKTIELATYYNNHSIEAITNFFADLLSLCTLLYLLITLEIQINITKSFLLEVFFGLDDSKKSLLILLITDLLVGYHSSNLWELFFEFIFNHYGIPESQTGIFLLVATLPVLLDVLFKYLIFRHLNRSSPATVATYQAIIE
uniref:Envelope membrane protein n=1 Tax=Volvox africanus TaxID=51714 RepID=A0A385KPQ4_9CHLO|nr:envelope membrane protein [Volvox africanus]AXZ97329.1 envelope membrane protein [Volvox africanus]